MNLFDYFTQTELFGITVLLLVSFYLYDLLKGKPYPAKSDDMTHYEHHMAWINTLDEKEKAIELAKLNRTVARLEKVLGKGK